ncbi:MAG: sodium:solute symporter family protein [Clostridiales Family XIII bacterium]|jgi:SSS family solute:Na+ symporter|nr:sodium:solute symporter family protein [Clostridiales Family XIII bacterium]
MLTLVLLTLYLIAMLLIGLYFRNRVHTTEDYYVAGRTVPWYLLMMTVAATYIGAGATMAETALAYDSGLQSVWPPVISMCAMLVFGLISPRVSKIGFKYGIISVSGLVAFRYGKIAGAFSAVIVVWALTGTLAGQISGAGTIIPVIFKNVNVSVSYEIAIVAMTLVMIAYTCVAGMFGVVWTDFIQCTILMLGMAVILPALMINSAGGMGVIREVVPPEFFSMKPGMYVIGLMVVYIFYFMSGPPYWQRAFAAKSPDTSRLGVILAVCLITFYSFMIAFLGISAKALSPELPGGETSQSIALTLMTQMYHPAVAAVITCAILAAIMSTMSGYLLTAVQAITKDIIRPFRKDFADKQEVRLAKIIVAIVGVLALLFAMVVRQILEALSLAMGFYGAVMAPSILSAVLWRKATAPGCWASMCVGVTVYLIWKFPMGTPFALNPTVPAGICSLIAMIAVSLATAASHPSPFFEGVDRGDAVVRKGAQPREEKEAN